MTQASLEKKTTSALAIPMEDLFSEQGSGMEEVGSDDIAIPYLSIIQKTSARVERGKPEYDPSAKVGDFVNTVNGEYFDGERGVRVIPCYFRLCFVEKTAGKNGKFVAEHPANTPLALKTTRDKDNQEVLENGNVLVRTARHYVILVDTHDAVVITMRSTQLKTSRRWNTILAGRKMKGPKGQDFIPPTFSSVWKLQTVSQSNDQGSWHGFQLTPDGDLKDRGLYEIARDLANMVRGGEVREVGDDE